MNPWPIFWAAVAVLLFVFLLLPWERSRATREALLGMVSGAPDSQGRRTVSIHRVGLALGMGMLVWTDVKITNAVVRWIDRTSGDPFAYFMAAIGSMGSLAGVAYLGKNLIQAKATAKDPKEAAGAPS